MNLIGEQFYPTPESVARKMLHDMRFGYTDAILEPSAGRGDLIEAIRKNIERSSRASKKNNIDAIEISPELRAILRSKDIRVVHDDFMTFDTMKQYDYIIMNPPFSSGDEHLLKAIKLLAPGGTCVCLLNTETIENPYTNRRNQLIRKLEEWNAEITNLGNAFQNADRKTQVEVTMIHVTSPEEEERGPGIILESLKRDEQEQEKSRVDQTHLIDSRPIQAAIARYRLEERAGLALLDEYETLKPMMRRSLVTDYEKPLIKIDVTHNEYIHGTRRKYWEALFAMPEFTEQLTSNLQQELDGKIDELEHYDFTEVNILAIQSELSRHVLSGVESTIIKLFDQLSYNHAYVEGSSRNIHYFDGWKTNKAWYINKKVILPIRGFDSGDLKYYDNPHITYEAIRTLTDIEKSLDFLDGNRKQGKTTRELLEEARESRQSSRIRLRHVEVTFYKKGTTHIVFLEQDLLDRLNIFGCRHKNWLPPSYGKKRYDDMDRAERTVVDNFHGKERYDSICQKGLAIENFQAPIMLGCE